MIRRDKGAYVSVFVLSFYVSGSVLFRCYWFCWLLLSRGLFYSVQVREACDRHFFPHGFEVEGVLGRAR